jgi:hypothetical protein
VIQARQHSRLAQKLITSLLEQFCGKASVMLDLLKGALTAFQPQVICQVDAPHSPLTDSPRYFVTTS